MSNPESFIDEVTEEVRRDQLFAFFRKWGWLGVVLVVLIVGGAATNEILKARDARQAQALGDAILEASDSNEGEARVAALAALDVEGDAAALVALLDAADRAEPGEADEILAAIEANADLPLLYRDLATMKRVILPGGTMTPSEKLAALEPLAAPGAPFRVLAEEQMALAHLELGETEITLAMMAAILEDAEATETVRQRATELTVALGGTLDEQANE